VAKGKAKSTSTAVSLVVDPWICQGDLISSVLVLYIKKCKSSTAVSVIDVEDPGACQHYLDTSSLIVLCKKSKYKYCDVSSQSMQLHLIDSILGCRENGGKNPDYSTPRKAASCMERGSANPLFEERCVTRSAIRKANAN